jgi:activator of HSP90 ATPase
MILAGLAASPVRAQTEATTIHQEIDYKTSPERIYQALLDARQFSTLTGLPAEIHAEPGGTFKLFDGQIEGRIVELVKDRRIVEAWRPSYWEPGVYSIVKFELAPREAGTRVVLDHAGFTADKQAHLAGGWKEHYWEPLHKYLNA